MKKNEQQQEAVEKTETPDTEAAKEEQDDAALTQEQ